LKDGRKKAKVEPPRLACRVKGEIVGGGIFGGE
jgi:hypothetical protein